jgi:hypothetical protein
VSTRSPIGKVLVALATFVVAGATLVLGLAQAPPAAAGASCVAVVVDFRLLGGAVQTGCAQGDPSTGLQALVRAGFSQTPRPRDGLTCQIDARPACTDTTGTSYWSYWYRAAGSSRWVYATEGAGTHNPKPGSTEGWVWQDGGKTPPPNIRADVICPQLAATPSPTPTPTPTSTSTPSSTRTPSDPKPTRTASTRPSHRPSTKPTTTRTQSSRKPTLATSTPSGRGSSDPRSSSAAGSPAASSSSALAASQAPPSGGSAAGSAEGPANHGGGGALGGVAGLALGSLVVVGIGAAAVVQARRGGPS